jgi:hypothetical protein
MGRNMELSISDLLDNEHEIESPVCAMGKAEIEEIVRKFIETNLEITDSGTLYLHLKQLEYAIKTGIEQLKEQAFNSLGEHLGGASSGKLFGHDVSIAYPNEWHYSSAVDDLKERQKKELAGLQNQERQIGIARQVQGKGRITITLREK